MFEKIVLIKNEFAEDDILSQVQTNPHEFECTATVESIYRSEHAEAAQLGFITEAVVSVWNFEYNGEKQVRYKGELLEIYRTFRNDKKGRTELYLGQRIPDYE